MQALQELFNIVGAVLFVAALVVIVSMIHVERKWKVPPIERDEKYGSDVRQRPRAGDRRRDPRPPS